MYPIGYAGTEEDKIIHDYEDYSDLQELIDTVYNGSLRNKMKINIEKTKHMTYTRKTQYTVTRYFLNKQVICKSDKIKDLGVIFDSKLLFQNHIDTVTDCARRTLGCIVANWQCVNKPEVFLYLYVMLIRPKLEFASVIWNSASETTLNQIESVQQKAVNFMYFKYKLFSLFHDYQHLCKTFHVETLKERRLLNDYNFINNCLNGKVICEYVLNNVSFKIPPYNMRVKNCIITKSVKLSPVYRIVQSYNSVQEILLLRDDCHV